MDGALGVSTRAAASESSPGSSESDLLSASDVEMTAVTTHGWRLSDARLPVDHPFRLLAFVEQHGDVFEVMQLGVGFELHELGSLDAAGEFVIASRPPSARAHPSGELSSPC